MLKSYNFWIRLIAVILLLGRVVGAKFGLEIDSGLIIDLITTIASVLVVLGVIKVPDSGKNKNGGFMEISEKIKTDIILAKAKLFEMFGVTDQSLLVSKILDDAIGENADAGKSAGESETSSETNGNTNSGDAGTTQLEGADSCQSGETNIAQSGGVGVAQLCSGDMAQSGGVGGFLPNDNDVAQMDTTGTVIIYNDKEGVQIGESKKADEMDAGTQGTAENTSDGENLAKKHENMAKNIEIGQNFENDDVCSGVDENVTTVTIATEKLENNTETGEPVLGEAGCDADNNAIADDNNSLVDSDYNLETDADDNSAIVDTNYALDSNYPVDQHIDQTNSTEIEYTTEEDCAILAEKELEHKLKLILKEKLHELIDTQFDEIVSENF